MSAADNIKYSSENVSKIFQAAKKLNLFYYISFPLSIAPRKHNSVTISKINHVAGKFLHIRRYRIPFRMDSHESINLILCFQKNFKQFWIFKHKTDQDKLIRLTLYIYVYTHTYIFDGTLCILISSLAACCLMCYFK